MDWSVISRLTAIAAVLLAGGIPALIAAAAANAYGEIPGGLNDIIADPGLPKRIHYTLDQERMLMLSNGSYILHPRLVFQGLHILAFIGLPILIWQARRHRSARLLLGILTLIPIIDLLPPTAMLLGRLVTPALLFRFHWPISIAAALAVGWGAWVILDWLLRRVTVPPLRAGLALAAMASVLVVSFPQLQYSFKWLHEHQINTTVNDNFCTYAAPLLSPLKQLAPTSTFVLAESDIDLCLTSYAPYANVLEFRGTNAVRYYPITNRDEGWRRVYDSEYYSQAELVDNHLLDILNHWDAKYLIVRLDSPLETELRHLPGMFQPTPYTAFQRRIYAVVQTKSPSPIVAANSLLLEQHFSQAIDAYNKLLQGDADTRYLAYLGLGRAYLQSGDVDQAIAAWQHAAAPFAEAQPYALLGDAYIVKHDLNAAARAYERAVRLQPDNSIFLTQLGIVYGQMGQFDQAQASFSKAIAQTVVPGTMLYYQMLGQDLAQVNAYDLARQAYQNALADNPDKSTYLLIGQLEQSQRRFAQAEQAYRKYIAIDSWDANGYIGLGSLYQDQAQFDQAIQQYQQAIRMNAMANPAYAALPQLLPQQLGISKATHDLTGLVGHQLGFGWQFSRLGQLEARAGLLDQAMVDQQRAIDWQPQMAGFWQALGDEQFAAGFRQLAQTTLLRAGNQSTQVSSQINSGASLAHLFAQAGQTGSAIGQDWENLRNDPTRSGAYIDLGHLMEQQGQNAQALALYQRAALIDPFSSAPRIALGDYYRRQGDETRAIDLYKQALGLGAGADAYYALAQVYQSTGDLAQATANYQKAIAISPGKGESYVALGQIDWQNGNHQQARAQYQRSIQLDPHYTPAYTALASSYLADGRPNDAKAVYQQAIANLPTADFGYQQLAQFYLQTGDPALAESTYEKAIAKFAGPNAVLSRLGLAQLLQQQGIVATLPSAPGALLEPQPSDPPTDAATLIQAAITAQPTDSNSYIELAKLRAQQGQWSQADQVLQDGLAVNPGSPELLTAQGDLYVQEGQIQQATEAYQRALTLQPTFAQASQSLATLYLQLGQPDKAQAQLDQAIQLQPGNTALLDSAATLYLAEGKPDQALQIALKRKDLASGDAQSWLVLGQVYAAQARFNLASDAYHRATTLEPGNYQAWLDLGQFLAARAQPEEAKAALAKSIQADRSRSAPHFALAQILERQGQTQAAIAEYQTAAKLDTTQDAAWLALGRIEQQAAQRSAAQQDYNRAIAAAPADPNAYQALATLYLQQGQFDQARQTLVTATNVAPGACMAYQNLGDFVAARGDLTTAESNYRRAMGLAGCAATARVALGNLDLAQAQPAQAMDEYRQAVAAAPGDPFAYAVLADTLTNQARPSDAMAVYQQAIARAPASDLIYAAQGRNLLAQGKLQQGLTATQQAVNLSPSNALDWVLLGNAYELLGQYSDAEKSYQSAADAERNLPDPPLALAGLYARLANSDKARAVYQQAIQIAPGDPLVYQSFGTYLQSRNQIPDAITAFQQGIAADKSRIDSLMALGKLYQTLARYSDAEQSYRQALAIGPATASSYTSPTEFERALTPASVADGYVALGDLNRQQGNEVAAEQAYRQAIAAEPANPTGYLSLGQALQAQNRQSDAMIQYQSAAKADPTSAPAYIAQADLYQLQADNADAEKFYQQAIQAALAQVAGYIRLGQFYQSKAEWDKAMAQFDLAISAAPASAQGYVAKGDLQGLSGDVPSQEQSYRRAIALAPSDPSAYIQLGDAYQLQARQQDALVQFQAAVNAAPASAQAWIALGDWQASQAQQTLAQHAYQHAIQVSPTDPIGYNSASRALEMQDRQADALAQWQAGEAANPGNVDMFVGAASYLLRRGEVVTATLAYQQAANLEPGNVAARIALAQASAWQAQFDKAEQALKDSIAAAPGLAAPYVALGDYYAGRRNWDGALSAYQQALAQEPSNDLAHQGIVTVYLLENRPDLGSQEAARWLGAALPGDSAPLFASALAKQVAGDFNGAATIYQQITHRLPGDADGYAALAQVLQVQGKFDQAVSVLNQGLAVTPNFPAAYLGRGEALQVLGKTDAALSDYRQASSLDASSADPFIAQARMLAATGNLDQAIALHRQAIVADPTNLEPYRSLANIYLAQNDSPDAIAVAQQAVQKLRSEIAGQINPSSARIAAFQGVPVSPNLQARVLLAQAYTAHFDMGSALATLQDALPVWHEDSALILTQIAQVYDASGNLNAAQQYYQQAQTSDPTFIDSYLDEGDLFLLKPVDNSNQAISLYEQAVRIDGTQPQVYAKLFHAYAHQRYGAPAVGVNDCPFPFKKATRDCNLQLGEYTLRTGLSGSLQTQYEAAAAAQPNSVQAQIQLAMFYEAFHLDGKAIETWPRVLQLAPTNVDAYRHLGVLYVQQDAGQASAVRALGQTIAMGSNSQDDQTLLADLNHDHFSFPDQGAVISGTVKIVGTADGNSIILQPGFSYYKIEIGAGAQPTEWTPLTLSKQPVTNDALATWDTTNWTDGTYTLRLTVVNPSGNYKPWYQVTVQVKNTNSLGEGK